MLKTTELLDLARERQGGVSDYRLAQLLKVDQTSVSNYRTGRSSPKNPVAMRLAELCELDPAEVMTWVNIERATTPEERSAWEVMLQRVSRTSRAKKAS
jgi:predicted transcriptional regulator